MANLIALAFATAVLVAIPGPNVALIAAVNPKTLLFIAAFLPQFVVANGSITGQFAAVGAVFLCVLLAGDVVWALSAASARKLFGRYGKARNRITGGFLVAAGVGLAMARR